MSAVLTIEPLQLGWCVSIGHDVSAAAQRNNYSNAYRTRCNPARDQFSASSDFCGAAGGAATEGVTDGELGNQHSVLKTAVICCQRGFSRLLYECEPALSIPPRIL